MKTLSIIDMLNQIRASNKPVKIETINQPPFYLVDEDKLAANYSINDVATDNNGVYLLRTNSAANTVLDGITKTEEREELVNLANVSRIILS